MAGSFRHDDEQEGDVAVKRERKTERVRRYQVIFHNDRYTTKWFVVIVLQRFFHMSETAATAFMMAVHEHGRGVAGIYTKDIAESKVDLVQKFSREQRMPLKLTAEPED